MINRSSLCGKNEYKNINANDTNVYGCQNCLKINANGNNKIVVKNIFGKTLVKYQ